jgi:transposase
MNGNGKLRGNKPETEVIATAQRRQYSREDKKRILAEIDGAREPGEVGTIMRREGLYSQLIS